MEFRRVMPANHPYEPHNMGTFGKASYMLIRQHNFPNRISELDKVISRDSDRFQQNNPETTEKTFRDHIGCSLNEYYTIEAWFRESDPEKIQSFIQALMENTHYIKKGGEFTGFRVMGTNVSGHAVWTFQLFIKHRDSPVELYSEDDAPNVLKD